MQIKPLNPGFIIPTKGSEQAGAYDIYMPTNGYADFTARMIPLGFAAAVPTKHVALILPRSGCGSKFGLELNNTCGIIDSDYRGEWKASVRTKNGDVFEWKAGDRLFQFLIIPVTDVELSQVQELDTTVRGTGGFGSSG